MGWRLAPLRNGLIVATVVLAACASSHAVVISQIAFEDIFGPCPDSGTTSGPGTTTVGGVVFSTPDAFTFNLGKPVVGPGQIVSPFTSD